MPWTLHRYIFPVRDHAQSKVDALTAEVPFPVKLFLVRSC